MIKMNRERLRAGGECDPLGAPTERANTRPGLDQRSDETDLRPDGHSSTARVSQVKPLSQHVAQMAGFARVRPADRP